jgi:hypothetical protein
MKNTAKKNKYKAGNPQAEAGIASKILVVLRQRLVKWLESNTSHYSKTKSFTLLTVFCVGTAILLCWIAAKGFYSGEKNNFHPDRISKKVVTPREEFIMIPSRDDISKRLSKGRRFLDSLAKDPSLKYKYDSLLWARPGLLDSLKRAEDYYKH